MITQGVTMIKKLMLISSLTLCTNAIAQESMTEEVIVTGIMGSEDYYEMPAVTLKKQGDFLVQSVKVINDSRNKELRETEIRQTLQALADSAAKNGDLKLSYGDEFLRPLNPKDKSLDFTEDKSRPDTSYIYISVKQKINASKPAFEQEASLEKFIKSTKKTGRTELDISGDMDLSIVNPEKYRYEILKKISAESTQLRTALDQNCNIQIDGLSNRVQWARTDIIELTVYIPHKTQVICTH
jgi:hypothetical protein